MIKLYVVLDVSLNFIKEQKQYSKVGQKSMNITSKTTTLRLTPAKAFLQLQHQANHYKNIIHPRKITSHLSSREHHRNRKHSGFLDSKFEKQKMQSIQQQNIRIVKDCHSIYRATGILQKVQNEFQTLQKSPKPSLINTFLVKQKMEKIKKENIYLKKKLENLKPIIGDKQKWKRHEVYTTELLNKLQNKSRSQSYNTETIVRIALSSQNQKIHYLKIFKTFNLDRKENLSGQKISEIKVKGKKQKKRRRNKTVRKQFQNLESTQKYNQTIQTKTDFSSQIKQVMNSQEKDKQ